MYIVKMALSCFRAVTLQGVIVLGVIVNLLPAAYGQFPMACQANITQNTGVCCPVPNGFIQPCGGEGRGACIPLPEVRVKYYPDLPTDLLDERMNWPNSYVQQGCTCLGNYYGADCSQCKFGYTGENCDARQHFVRRSIKDYSAEEKEVFVNTLLSAKQVSSGLGVVLPPGGQQTNVTMEQLTIYELFQYLHYRTSHRTVGNCGFNINFAHSGPGFPTWHRRYLLWVERELRSVSEDPAFTLPYWDWVDAENCTVCTNDLVGAINKSDPAGMQGVFYLEEGSPFSEWGTSCGGTDTPCGLCDPRSQTGRIVRSDSPGISNLTYPNSTEIKVMLDNDRYEGFLQQQNQAFRQALEDEHGIVHDRIGGSMGRLLTAANDPIFLFHHTFVDKLLEVWFHKNGVNPDQYPESQRQVGHLAHEPMVPFYPPENNIDYYKQSADFGYQYDTMCLSYQDEKECSPTAAPTPPMTTTNQSPITNPASSALPASTTSTTPNEEGEDVDMWKTIAIVAVVISGILVILFAVAIVTYVCRTKQRDSNREQRQLNANANYSDDPEQRVGNSEREPLLAGSQYRPQ